VTYGHHKYERDDRLLADSKRRNKFASGKIHPGSLLINHVPLCMCFLLFAFGHRQADGPGIYISVRYIPDWLPWFSYKPIIRIGTDLGNQVLYPPVRKVKESMVSQYLFEYIITSRWLVKHAVAQWYSASLACSRESSRVGEPEIKWT
jgi:hypothetical protein